jgi:hypothetical protein
MFVEQFSLQAAAARSQEIEGVGSDKFHYDVSKQLADSLLAHDVARRGLFSYGLGLRYFSPAVAMHKYVAVVVVVVVVVVGVDVDGAPCAEYSRLGLDVLQVLEKESGEKRCPTTTWAVVNRNVIVCRAKELPAAIKRASSASSELPYVALHCIAFALRCIALTLNFVPSDSLSDLAITLEREHVYPFQDSSSNKVEVVVYSDFTTRHFLPFHEYLSARVNSTNDVSYILRHFFTYKAQDSEKLLQLQGYGAEMVFKNIEYKAIDETAKSMLCISKYPCHLRAFPLNHNKHC